MAAKLFDLVVVAANQFDVVVNGPVAALFCAVVVRRFGATDDCFVEFPDAETAHAAKAVENCPAPFRR